MRNLLRSMGLVLAIAAAAQATEPAGLPPAEHRPDPVALRGALARLEFDALATRLAAARERARIDRASPELELS